MVDCILCGVIHPIGAPYRDHGCLANANGPHISPTDPADLIRLAFKYRTPALTIDQINEIRRSWILHDRVIVL